MQAVEEDETWFIFRNGFEVYEIDLSAEAIGSARDTSKNSVPENSLANFRVAAVEEPTFVDVYFDLAICGNVPYCASNKLILTKCFALFGG